VAVLERTFESALELQSGSQLSGLLDWYGYPASLCVHKRGGECSQYQRQRQQYVHRTIFGEHTASCQLRWVYLAVITGRDDRFPTKLALLIGQS
jgi:hypothetical protein